MYFNNLFNRVWIGFESKMNGYMLLDFVNMFVVNGY